MNWYARVVKPGNAWWGYGSMPRIGTRGHTILLRGSDRHGINYHYAYHTGKKKWIANCQGGPAYLWQWNRQYGSKYKHKSGSKFRVRKKTYIKHKGGKTYLYPGDWVAVNYRQGYYYNANWSMMRVDGFYKNGRFRETNGGWVYMPLETHPHNYTLNTT
jgi:hypothetical protein